jgi:hypothetical protein
MWQRKHHDHEITERAPKEKGRLTVIDAAMQSFMHHPRLELSVPWLNQDLRVLNTISAHPGPRTCHVRVTKV